jgi:hypothetical protein
MKYCCDREQKRIYCDKSLDAAQYLPAVHRTFPTAKYILLVRHVMDTIASGLEASPWGYGSFGYGPYVQATPDNVVLALARYWEGQMSLALAWEKEHAEQVLRVHYEDLVAHPEAVMATVWEFLGVAKDDGVVPRSFERFRPASGPGDYKLAFTSAVSQKSVGRGKRVPVSLLPEPMLERLNCLLRSMGYDDLTEAWNTVPADGPTADSLDVAELTCLVEGGSRASCTSRLGRVAVIADDVADARWVLDVRTGDVVRGDGEVELGFTGAARDLVLMLRGQVNAGVLLRSGRIRLLTPPGSVTQAADVAATVREFVTYIAERGDGRDAAAALGYQ